MEDGLFHLINELENEKSSLSELIEIAIEEGEYLSAHFHSEALQIVSHQIWILRGLEDKQYHQKRSKTRQMESLLKSLSESSNKGLQSYYLNRLSELKKEIAELVKESNHSKQNPKTFLDEYLCKLSLGELDKIKIVLSDRDNFIIWIVTESNGVEMKIPNANRLILDYSIREENIAKLKSLGFQIQEDTFSLKIIGERNFILEKMKQTIAILVFEVFHFSQFSGNSFVEI
jgi:hypothetical protein